MKLVRPDLSGGRWAEYGFALAIVCGIGWCSWHLYTYHYLPAPFFWEPGDVYADWFNTAFWARDKGTYDAWKTVYPPLSFVFLRLVGMDRCYPDRRGYDVSAGLAARECDSLGVAMIWVIYAINVFLIWRTFRKIDPKTAIPRTICVGFGMPMLDGVERGNLFLIAFTCLLLATGPILRSARLKWLFAGLAVNFKVYLIAAFVPLLLKRRWRWVECALISVVLVYMFSFAILGRGTPLEIVQNIRDFSNVAINSPLDIWFATTYDYLSSLLESDIFPTMLLIGSRNVELLEFWLPVLKHITQALILAAAAATWLRPEKIPSFRVINLGLMLALITSESGGYSPGYFLLFVMMERWRGIGLRWAIIACYILALPFDFAIDQTPALQHDTYFGGEVVHIPFYVTVSPFIRPLLIMTVAMALSLTTIRDVWLDVRLQGWADRWRFRRDAPLLPWVRRPEPRPRADAD